jgi:putative PIN family toxin of toxin-antitoxin system
MITVVLDTNTVVSAIFWPRSIARRCLIGLAKRQYALAVSSEIFAEYETVSAELQPRFPHCNSEGALAWLRFKAKWVEPAPLGKKRSRDSRDDPFLSCALSAQAKFLVTRDNDLLDLEKPFGIQMLSPIQFLGWMRESLRTR